MDEVDQLLMQQDLLSPTFGKQQPKITVQSSIKQSNSEVDKLLTGESDLLLDYADSLAPTSCVAKAEDTNIDDLVEQELSRNQSPIKREISSERPKAASAYGSPGGNRNNSRMSNLSDKKQRNNKLRSSYTGQENNSLNLPDESSIMFKELFSSNTLSREKGIAGIDEKGLSKTRSNKSLSNKFSSSQK